MASLCRVVLLAIAVILVLEVTDAIAIYGHSSGSKAEATRDMDVLVRTDLIMFYQYFFIGAPDD